MRHPDELGNFSAPTSMQQTGHGGWSSGHHMGQGNFQQGTGINQGQQIGRQQTNLPSWTQAGPPIQQEGQRGMGPSLYLQGGSGQYQTAPGWNQGVSNMNTGYFGQSNLPHWTRGTQQAVGEGSRGLGPSSLAGGGGPEQYQFAQGGQHWQQTVPQAFGIGGSHLSHNLPSWTRGAGDIGFSQSDAIEGAGGMGPSSVAQNWGQGQQGYAPMAQQGFSGQQLQSSGYYGAQSHLPSWTAGAGTVGTEQEGQGGMGPSSYFQGGIPGQQMTQGSFYQGNAPQWQHNHLSQGPR